jgi:hypothetical protein
MAKINDNNTHSGNVLNYIDFNHSDTSISLIIYIEQPYKIAKTVRVYTCQFKHSAKALLFSQALKYKENLS